MASARKATNMKTFLAVTLFIIGIVAFVLVAMIISSAVASEYLDDDGAPIIIVTDPPPIDPDAPAVTGDSETGTPAAPAPAQLDLESLADSH